MGFANNEHLKHVIASNTQGIQTCYMSKKKSRVWYDKTYVFEVHFCLHKFGGGRVGVAKRGETRERATKNNHITFL